MEFLDRAKEFLGLNRQSGRTFVDVASANDNSPVYDQFLNTVNFPTTAVIDGYEYLRYGDNDDLDAIVSALLYRSATNKGVVGKTASIIAGKDLEIKLKSTKSTVSKIKWDILKTKLDGNKKSFHKVYSDGVKSYIEYGVAYLLVSFETKACKTIKKIEVLPPRTVRAGKPNINSEITYYLRLRSGFNNRHNSAYASRTVERIETFTGDPKQGKEQIYCIRQSEDISPNYGIPDWITAYHFIQSDYNFGRHVENSSETGFSPTVSFGIVGRGMTEEDKEKASNKIKSNFMGSTGDKTLISFVRNKEEMPVVQTVEANNLDKTIDVMSKLNDSKILTANSATSPSLFGVMIAGTMGGTGNEMLIAYEVFKATVAIAIQREFIAAFKHIFANTDVKIESMEVVDPDLMKDNNDKTAVSDYTAKKGSSEKKKDGDYE